MQRSRPPVRLGLVSALEAGADVHHRRTPRMDRADDLLDIDPLQVTLGVETYECPNWRWITGSGTPSRASSTA
jgi:hypothetical protein